MASFGVAVGVACLSIAGPGWRARPARPWLGSVTVVGGDRPRDGAASGAAATPSSSGPDWTPAPLARRFGALVLDWILCLLISRLFANPTQAPWVP
ncbi:MAG TPA: hypothetical protein VF163_07760, partial [Micromonosporaceae bacterium]